MFAWYKILSSVVIMIFCCSLFMFTVTGLEGLLFDKKVDWIMLVLSSGLNLGCLHTLRAIIDTIVSTESAVRTECLNLKDRIHSSSIKLSQHWVPWDPVFEKECREIREAADKKSLESIDIPLPLLVKNQREWQQAQHNIRKLQSILRALEKAHKDIIALRREWLMESMTRVRIIAAFGAQEQIIMHHTHHRVREIARHLVLFSDAADDVLPRLLDESNANNHRDWDTIAAHIASSSYALQEYFLAIRGQGEFIN